MQRVQKCKDPSWNKLGVLLTAGRPVQLELGKQKAEWKELKLKR